MPLIAEYLRNLLPLKVKQAFIKLIKKNEGTKGKNWENVAENPLRAGSMMLTICSRCSCVWTQNKERTDNPATPIFPLASAFDMQISVCYEKSSQGGDNLTPTRFTTWHKQL